MQMLTVMGLVSRLPLEDPHEHIDNLRSMCKIFFSRRDLDINFIGL